MTRSLRFFSFRSLLVTCAAVSALGAALVSNGAAHVASATNEAYNCSSNWGKSTCNYVHGADNWVKNAEGVNYTNRGNTCANITNDGKGGSFCVSYPGYFIFVCLTSEVYGHGWAETANGESVNLAGHEDNFSECR